MEKHLKNKSVLVTGGNRGIGRAISEYFLDNGARVAVQYLKNKEMAEQLVREYGNKVTLFQCDLSKAFDVNTFFNDLLQKFKRIDVIVNNAGIAIHSDMEKDEIQWLDDWIKTIDVNLNAVGLICKRSINYFMENNIRGRIINISSRAAFRGDQAEYMAYAASKGGVVALTRSIARAYGKEGIVAFNVAPGFVKTDMARKFFDEYGENYGINEIALEKLTMPEDIAPFVGFLASGLADHATGGTFDINAGSYVH